MKKIGIIFAMKEELESLLKYIKLENEYNIFELKFYEGKLENNKCILVQSGVGKVNAARCTQILIDNMDVDYILNIGVAGGINEKLKVCDIVIGEKLVQHDFDITAFNHEKGYIPNIGTFLESDCYLFKIASNISHNQNYNVHSGVIASGDIFCTETKMSEKIKNKFNALCVEMEGASIAQVCYLSHVPFLIIRSISDVVNNNNTMTYEEFLKIACENVSDFVSKILKSI